MRLCLEEALLQAFHAFALRCAPAPVATSAAAAAAAATKEAEAAAPLVTTPAEPPLPSAARKRPWYIDELQLCALRLQVGADGRSPAGPYAGGLGARCLPPGVCTRDRPVVPYRQVSYRRRPEVGGAAEGEWRVPLALPNLEGVSLSLTSLAKHHFFVSRAKGLKDIVKHYKTELMRNLFKARRTPPAVVPTTSSSRTCTYSLALHGHRSRPAALAPRPFRLWQVLLHADLSSVVSDKVASMTGGRTLGSGSADGKPRHLAEGVLQGGLGLGKGLFSGITGLVAAPVRGAAEGAAEGKALSGFARGLGKGLVGVAVKPTAGVLVPSP